MFDETQLAAQGAANKTEDPKAIAAAELKALEKDPKLGPDYPGHHNAHKMPIRVVLHDRKAVPPAQNQSVTVYPGDPELAGVIGGPQVKHALAAGNLPRTARLKAHRDGVVLDPWDSLYAHAHDGDHYEVI
jgi:hypothetical protein